jgi:hypothetical protein
MWCSGRNRHRPAAVCHNHGMTSPAERFLSLSGRQLRAAHMALAEHALERWRAYASARGPMRYRETVAGTVQAVDADLPADAMRSARAGRDEARVGERYREPIAALQDKDWELPEPVGFAYYAIYNAFGKYAAGRPVDDWLIVNQALSSEQDPAQRALVLMRAVDVGLATARADAWQFRSDLTLEQMKTRLDAAWPTSWMERDSDRRPDSISGALDAGSSARIFHYGADLFVVNLAARGDPKALYAAETILLRDVLPVVGARQPAPCDPVD